MQNKVQYSNGASSQQQHVVTVGTGQQQEPVESFMAQKIFSCVVLWFCNWIFGLAAYVMAG